MKLEKLSINKLEIVLGINLTLIVISTIMMLTGIILDNSSMKMQGFYKMMGATNTSAVIFSMLINYKERNSFRKTDLYIFYMTNVITGIFYITLIVQLFQHLNITR